MYRSALATDRADLTLAFNSLRGASLDDRLAAASEAGFAGVGFRIGDLRDVCGALGASTVATMLDEYVLKITELEAIVGFASEGRPQDPLLRRNSYADQRDLSDALMFADQFGCQRLVVCGAFDRPLEPDLVERFGALCDLAAPHDLSVVLEPMPCTNVVDVATGAHIVAQADRRNGGLLIDSWHLFRGAGGRAQLLQLRPEHVIAIQLSDGTRIPVEDNYLLDASRNRLPVGEGEFPLRDFLDAIPIGDGRPAVSVEVMNASLDRLPAREVALRLVEGARLLLTGDRSVGDQPSFGSRSER